MTNTKRLPSPPPLPTEKSNPLISNYKGRLRSVKTQDITLTQKLSIKIARVKVPTPSDLSGHLIKRFDTNSISASSFFRSAYPTATDEEESIQMEFLSTIFDTSTAAGDNLGPEYKLTGTWVPIKHAQYVAELYGISKFAQPLIDFENPAQKSLNNNQKLLNTQGNPKVDSNPNDSKITKHSSPSPRKPNNSNNNNKTIESANPPTPQANRSSKRPRMIPPDFGNTSPSRFSLNYNTESLNDPSENNNDNYEQEEGNEQSVIVKDIQNSKDLNDKSKRADEEGDEEEDQLAPTETGLEQSMEDKMERREDGENEDQAGSKENGNRKLIGTDKDAEAAQRDALKLVDSIRNQVSVENSNTSSAATNGLSPSKASNAKKESLNKKRSIDEIQSDEAQDSSSFSRFNIFSRFWNRNSNNRASNSSGNSQKDLVKKRSVINISKFASADNSNVNGQEVALQSEGLESGALEDNRKRNLAVAGIVIAGAAASIAPYFL